MQRTRMDSSSENPEIQENQRTEQSEYPPLDLPPALFRLSLGLVFLGAVSYFTLNLFRALSNHQSFGEALGGILLDPWATSALVDYLAGLSLSMPYLWATSDSLLSALLKIFTLFCLGNPILLLIVAFDLFRGPENLKKTLLKPDKRNPSLPDYQFLGLLIVQGFAAISLLVYVAIVIRALAMEPVSEGWTYIKADLWSFVTFIDNLLGILFAMAYITCREHGSVLNALVWAATLFFLGNGVTCVYVLLLTRRKESVQEAFLSDESVTRLAQGFHRID